MSSPARHAVPAALALALAACGGVEDDLSPPAPLAEPVRVSGASPFAPGCNPAAQRGTRYLGAEVEPALAVNPVDPDHLVAAWQQDRWSAGGGSDGLVAAASKDGGITWTASLLPFSLCGGGSGRGGGYQRATDPWVAFSSDGKIVHQIGLAFDVSTPGNMAVLATRSTDGGFSWSDPVALAAEVDPDRGLDKPTLTADPVEPLRAYAVWDRLTGLTSTDPSLSTGPAWFSRTADGGATWTAPAVLYDPGADAQTISSQIVVLPGGALVDVLVRITAASTATPLYEVVSTRSADLGDTWTAPAIVGTLRARGARDPKTGHAVRAGEVVPSTAVDPVGGALYVVWEDDRFSGGARDGIALSRSTDGGLTWSPPMQVNGAPGVQAFRPAVAVGSGGAVAVTYYDFRNDILLDRDHTWTTFWLSTSADGARTFRDAPLGGPFDLRTAPDVDGWFLGDYTGLVPARGGFRALFGMSGAATDVFASR
jgi:BNR repeat-like domain